MNVKTLVSAFAVAAMMSYGSTTAKAQTPRPEYPRPQFERSEWVNLNGTWTYSFDFGRRVERVERKKGGSSSSLMTL